jgi:glycine C-acetyltransferase
MTQLSERLRNTLAELRASGTHKTLRHLTGPTGPVTTIEGLGEVLVFCSNNYLGLANHPAVVEAGVEGLRRYGAGTASVRFICGTFECHRELEHRLAHFLGTESALTFVSCWNANEGLLPSLTREGDAIVSDALNHASIIDAGRLSRPATRRVFPHGDVAALETILGELDAAPVKLVVTDGVFSMEGDVAPLPDLVAVCSRHAATLIVDDSHGVGVLGAHGRGTAEHFHLAGHGPDGVDILTGTLGKSLGGAAGGYVAGPAAVIDYLIQRSRPQLFSNALPPTVACSAAKALEILEHEPGRVTRLQANTHRMRLGLRRLGYQVLDSASAIVPVMVGDSAQAIRLSEQLLDRGIFIVGFGFPVVPEGAARLRIQMSAAHSDQHIDRVLDAFEALRS